MVLHILKFTVHDSKNNIFITERSQKSFCTFCIFPDSSNLLAHSSAVREEISGKLSVLLEIAGVLLRWLKLRPSHVNGLLRNTTSVLKLKKCRFCNWLAGASPSLIFWGHFTVIIVVCKVSDLVPFTHHSVLHIGLFFFFPPSVGPKGECN